jgi:hypothetical protein
MDISRTLILLSSAFSNDDDITLALIQAQKQRVAIQNFMGQALIDKGPMEALS